MNVKDKIRAQLRFLLIFFISEVMVYCFMSEFKVSGSLRTKIYTEIAIFIIFTSLTTLTIFIKKISTRRIFVNMMAGEFFFFSLFQLATILYTYYKAFGKFNYFILVLYFSIIILIYLFRRGLIKKHDPLFIRRISVSSTVLVVCLLRLLDGKQKIDVCVSALLISWGWAVLGFVVMGLRNKIVCDTDKIKS